MQQFSAEGLKLLMKAEGFRRSVYCDPIGKPTIGYGHRLLSGEDFPNGMSEGEAQALLNNDILAAEECVRLHVHVPITQGQFDALVDFVFNLGCRHFSGSTLLKLLNQGCYAEAAQQILLWDHAGGVEAPGLMARREAELALWSQPDSPAAEKSA